MKALEGFLAILIVAVIGSVIVIGLRTNGLLAVGGVVLLVIVAEWAIRE